MRIIKNRKVILLILEYAYRLQKATTPMIYSAINRNERRNFKWLNLVHLNMQCVDSSHLEIDY